MRAPIPRGSRAQAWPFSQALWATVDLAEPARRSSADTAADLLERIRALAAYSHPEPGRPSEFAPVYGGSGACLLRRQPLDRARRSSRRAGSTRTTSPLATAAQLFDARRATAGTPSDAHPCPGGVFWTRLGAEPRPQHRHDGELGAARARASTQRPARRAYLDVGADGLRLDASAASGRSNGLIADHIDLDGPRRRAHVELQPGRDDRGRRPALPARPATRSYLTDADADRRTRRSASSATRSRSGEPPCLPRDLLPRPARALGRRRAAAHDRAAIQAFADEAWANARDPQTGLFRFGGRGPTLLDQAAMVQVYAELAR